MEDARGRVYDYDAEMFHIYRFFCVVTGCLSVGLWGCSNAASEPVLHEDIPITWEKSGTYSHLSRAVRILARDRATLAQVPITEVPVDFEREMVLIAGLGPTPSSERGIRITRVWADSGRLRVQETQLHPGTEQQPGLRPASPWSVAVIPRSDLNVEGYSVQVPRGLISPAGSGSGASAASGSVRRPGQPR